MRRWIGFLILLSCLTIVHYSCGKESDDDDDDNGDEETEETDTTTSGSGSTVVDGDGVEIGTIYFHTDWPRTLIQQDNGGIGAYNVLSGAFVSGLCEDDFCNHANITTDSDDSNVEGYCFFDNRDCSGSCYTTGKPVKNSIFQSGENSFVIATGDEEVRDTQLWPGSYYSLDLAECISTPNAVFQSYKIDAYEIDADSTYEFDEKVKFPFEGPLDLE